MFRCALNPSDLTMNNLHHVDVATLARGRNVLLGVMVSTMLPLIFRQVFGAPFCTRFSRIDTVYGASCHVLPTSHQIQPWHRGVSSC